MNFIVFVNEHYTEILTSILQHIYLVFFSVMIGILFSIPAGILLSRHKKAAEKILAVVSIVQTIPGLVMLGLALLIFGVGNTPALVVLSIYSVLPILRNTYTGLTEVQPGLIEAGRGIGMTLSQLLFRVQLPLAMPSIISGIRISTVYIVSWAALAGLIGAGGLGDLIWTGLSTYNTNYILAGAIPSAILAFLFSGIIGGVQRLATPRGLRGSTA
ncbi:MAG: ABC transporter permease [Oscillospiraceae bacterium]|nr:ABC transporter permease [Oscillospiraceae bacterium]